MRSIGHTHHRGFTLIEIIVSLGIFAVVAVVALGALVRIITANKKAQTVQAAVTNINFALDAMSREIRVGRNYYCTNDFSGAQNGGDMDNVSPGNTLPQGDYTDSTKCPDGQSDDGNGTLIAFNSAKVDPNEGNPCNLIYAYLFFKEANGSYSLNKAEQTDCNSSSYDFSSIIDPNVTITGYYVRVVAADANSFPRATIRVSGYAGVLEKEKTFFDVQTSMSTRIQ